MKKSTQKNSLPSALSKESFSAIVKNIPDLIWIKDANGIYLGCNKRFEDFFGAKESEIIGKTDYDFVDKEQADFFRKHDQQALDTNKPVRNYEELTFKSDGHKEYTHVTKTVLYDSNNKFLGILGVGRDFTQQQKIQDELEKTLNRLELAINSTQDGVWDWDPITNKVFFSDNWKSMLGYENDEIGDSVEEWSSRIHPDDIEEVMIKLNKHLEKKSDLYISTHRLRCKDNTWKWILDRGKAQFDDQGKVNRVIGYHTDISQQKNDEVRLQEALSKIEKDKIKYQTLMENSSEAIFIINDQGFVIECSKLFKELLGYTDKEVYTLHVSNFEGIHTKEEIDQNIHKNFSYKPVSFESKYRKKDGTLIDVSLNIIKIKISEVDYFYCSCRDISNIKKYEKKLKHQTERLELAQSSASIGIWELDLTNNKFHTDERTLEIFERTAQDFDGSLASWAKMLDEDELKRVNKAREDTILYNKPYNIEYKINLKTGGFKYVKVTGTLIKDDENKPIRLIGTVLDNTEERVKNDKIKEQKDEFEAIFTNSKDGIALIDLESNFLDCNDAYLEMMEYTKEELLEQSCISLTIPEEKEDTKEALNMGLKYGYLKNYEKTCITKSGRKVKVNMTASLLPDQKRFLIVTKDMTLIKLLDEQSRLAAMGEMIGNIAHQWRQPLSVISASASALELRLEYDDQIDKESIQKTTDRIIKQIEYLSDTIDDFRNFIKGGNTYKEISLKESISKTFNLIAPSLKNNFISLKEELEDDLVIIGNKNELQQALINIINNAKDALRENIEDEDDRFIFVKTKMLDDHTLELTIKDSGGGIPEDVIGRIFEPYFTTKDENTGTGIGLSMVDKIIKERHSAELSVSNEEYTYEGKKYKGAMFRIVFHSNID